MRLRLVLLLVLAACTSSGVATTAISTTQTDLGATSAAEAMANYNGRSCRELEGKVRIGTLDIDVAGIRL